MHKHIVAAALLLTSGVAAAAPRATTTRQKAPIDYTEKNRKYFAKLDRLQQKNDPAGWQQTLRDRAYNSRGANPAWVAPVQQAAGIWWQGAMAASFAVNPVGTKRAMEIFLSANAYRMPF